MTISPVPDFRAASPVLTLIRQLGPLAELPGTWKGHGFNLISRPDFQQQHPLFLELNATDETLEFSSIGGPIPNRGSAMGDIEIFGVHYLQQVSDHDHASAIHLEPGIWLNVPATEQPSLPATVVRLATIPHGTSINVQGSSFTVAGPPQFAVASTTPFKIGDPTATVTFPEFDLATASNFRSPTPSNATQEVVNDPNTLLKKDIAGQTISQTIVLDVSTQVAADNKLNFAGGSQDIAFLGKNADVAAVSAIFWIETVQQDRAPFGGRDFLQLQYTQTVLLNFDGLSWPHVSVATLRKVV